MRMNLPNVDSLEMTGENHISSTFFLSSLITKNKIVKLLCFLDTQVPRSPNIATFHFKYQIAGAKPAVCERKHTGYINTYMQ